MRLLPVLLVLTSIEAKRRRLENQQDHLNGRKNTNNVDVYPESFGPDVDFGHVYRNEDRRQTTVTELDMINPTSIEHARQLLRKMGSDIINMKKPEAPLGFANPRDAMLYRNKIGQANSDRKTGNSLNRLPRLKNITQNIRKAVEEEVRKRYQDHSSHPQESPQKEEKFNRNDSHSNIEQFFSKSGFNLLSDEAYSYEKGNWTTCKEFAKGAVFHPDDVINIPWLPFFIWSTRSFSTADVHTLSYPTKKLVKQYKEKFGPFLSVKVDWEQPKLLLKEAKDNKLLIAGDRKGLFYGIPYVELPSSTNLNIKIPVITLRLKIVDPYLAIMFCDENYAAIMSVAGSEPETDEEKAAEASILKFRGSGKPAVRDLELETHKAKFEVESKKREEAMKYVLIEKPDTLDPSSW